jgi:hypothetical protein
MRKLLLIAFLVLSSTAAYAVPVECLAVLGGSGGNLQSLLNTNPGGGCFHQDKIFSNFVYSGAGATQQPASQVNAGHVFQVLTNQDIHGFVIAPVSGQWTMPLNFGFTVTVCTSGAQGCSDPNPFAQIFLVKQQTNTGVTPNGSVFSTLWTPNVGAPFTTTTTGASTAAETTQAGVNPAATQLTALGTYTPNGGNLLSVELDVVENTAIPEPATMALIGSGLLLVGFARRRLRG